VAEDLNPRPAWRVNGDGVPWLCGSRCARCAALTFPARAICHRCAGTNLEPAEIGTDGRLYSWSTVRVSSSRSVPYTIGYVDLPGGVRVLAFIEGDPASLRPDCAVRLIARGGAGDSDGELVFAPDGTGALRMSGPV
jgi:uncharacterized OB-fold protein